MAKAGLREGRLSHEAAENGFRGFKYVWAGGAQALVPPPPPPPWESLHKGNLDIAPGIRRVDVTIEPVMGLIH